MSTLSTSAFKATKLLLAAELDVPAPIIPLKSTNTYKIFLGS